MSRARLSLVVLLITVGVLAILALAIALFRGGP
jgi:hypothetical protein